MIEMYNNDNNNNNSRFIRKVEITRVMSVSVQNQEVIRREQTAEHKEHMYNERTRTAKEAK